MNEFRLYAVAQKILEESVKLEENENVCIVADTNTVEIGEVFASCVSAKNSTPVLVVMNPTKAHGVEPPATVAGAMKEADVILQPITHAITHTNATKEALEGGSRLLVMRGVTKELMLYGAVGADYHEIDRVSELVRQKMSQGSEVKMTSSTGTNLTLGINERTAIMLTGLVKGSGTFAAMPDGEAAIAPVEGTTEGTLVIDNTMDNLGLLDEPIHLTIEKGNVTKIEGGQSAMQLERLVNDSDEGARNIAEFAIGTNPDARLIGNMAEDKKAIGTVHVAIGDSHVIGGNVESNIHLDGLVLNPTVHIDDECIIDAGHLLIESMPQVQNS